MLYVQCTYFLQIKLNHNIVLISLQIVAHMPMMWLEIYVCYMYIHFKHIYIRLLIKPVACRTGISFTAGMPVLIILFTKWQLQVYSTYNQLAFKIL